MKAGKQASSARGHAVKISPLFMDGCAAWQAGEVMEPEAQKQAGKLNTHQRRALARIYFRWGHQILKSADLMDRQIVGLN